MNIAWGKAAGIMRVRVFAKTLNVSVTEEEKFNCFAQRYSSNGNKKTHNDECCDDRKNVRCIVKA
jgi:hypothetical protein